MNLSAVTGRNLFHSKIRDLRLEFGVKDQYQLPMIQTGKHHSWLIIANFVDVGFFPLSSVVALA